MRRMLAALVVVVAICAAISGTLALSSTPAHAKGCGICPMICIPVICDNGKVYCNGCLAACAGAHNCVPLFPPIPL